jgi:hypothetical protein
LLSGHISCISCALSSRMLNPMFELCYSHSRSPESWDSAVLRTACGFPGSTERPRPRSPDHALFVNPRNAFIVNVTSAPAHGSAPQVRCLRLRRANERAAFRFENCKQWLARSSPTGRLWSTLLWRRQKIVSQINISLTSAGQMSQLSGHSSIMILCDSTKSISWHEHAGRIAQRTSRANRIIQRYFNWGVMVF